MIIPSIDLMGGQTVQLVGGKDKALDAGDPVPFAEYFRLVGEVAVVDLDAALGQGTNTALIQKLCAIAPCRVGGGIRSVESANVWLDAGATKVVLGTAAKPDILKNLPKERVIAALDALHDEVMVKGWRERTGVSVIERMQELKPYVGGFLVTFVETEGRLQGIDLKRVEELVQAAAPCQLTVAGGVTTAQDVAEIDRMGGDAQVGMALYTKRFDLADALGACLQSDRPDGLWPTMVCDERGVALGLAWSNLESLRAALTQKRGVYQSRNRGLWVKGETSGAIQKLIKVDMDCDRDALRFIVEQHGAGFCHKNTRTCFGDDWGLRPLLARLNERLQQAPSGSYTKRLLDDSVLLRAKLVEEAGELADASGQEHVSVEAADLLYFALVAMARGRTTIADTEAVLDKRALQVSRRPGHAKT